MCDFPVDHFSEFVLFSGEEFKPAIALLVFDGVKSCRDFCGVAPLRRPALWLAGDAGNFCGDLFIGGVTLRRFDGVQADVLDDVRFCGEAEEFVAGDFVLVLLAVDSSVCKPT